MHWAKVKHHSSRQPDGLGSLQGFLPSSNRVEALAPGTSLSAHRFSMVLPSWPVKAGGSGQHAFPASRPL